ncbi:MAG: type II toxin-antitoxin system Phd/YefM family antitoxin [Polyangiaceae bacterium]
MAAPSSRSRKGVKSAPLPRKAAVAARTKYASTGKALGVSTVLLERHSISEARGMLPLLVRRAKSGAAPTIAITRNGKDEVVLVPVSSFEALRRRAGQSGEAIAEGVVERLLPGAPAHLVGPQLKELAALKPEQLKALAPVTRLPLRGAERARVTSAVGADVLSRLERRHAIARTLARATDEGLYEASEHLTGDLSVWDDKS